MVTAPELARRLGVDPKRLRAWLRAQAAAGHPLLTAHGRNARWEFTEAEAEDLTAELRGRPSSSQGPPPRATRRARAPRSRSAGSTEMPPLSDDPGHRVTEQWMGEDVLTLEDLLRPGLRAVVVGINPARVSVAAGHYWQGRTGRVLFSRLRQVGLVADERELWEDDAAFAAGVGFTDVVKRATASADEVASGELEYGRPMLDEKLARYEPGLVVFAFKGAAVTLLGDFPGFGFVPGLRVGETDVFVMPRPWEKRESAQAALDALAKRVRRRGVLQRSAHCLLPTGPAGPAAR